METSDAMESLNPVYRLYQFVNYDLQEPKTAELPLMLRPFSMILLLVAYNVGCLRLGPRLMESRQPFVLRNIMIAFDMFQIIINSYLFYKALDLGWLGHFNWFCGEIDYDDSPHARQIARTCYLYFFIKLTDMLDTVFMVLRKKNRHISFLHMYHHTGMIILTWGNAKYLPGGHHTCLGLYNSLVHVVMYSYYLGAAVFPSLDLSSFKKFVTKLQMIQFGMIILHLSTVLVAPNCSYPKWTLIFLLPQNFLMFTLFYDFYRKTYDRPKEHKH